MEYITLLANCIMAGVVVLGIILTVIGLPGNFLILLAAIFYGWQEDFSHLNYRWLLLLAALWGSGEIIEFIAGIVGAKKQRASRGAMLFAFIGSLFGGIAGTGVFPLVGTFFGAILGGFTASYAAEYFYTKDRKQAKDVAKGVVRGQLTGILIKLIIALSMAGAIFYKIWMV